MPSSLSSGVPDRAGSPSPGGSTAGRGGYREAAADRPCPRRVRQIVDLPDVPTPNGDSLQEIESTIPLGVINVYL